MEKEIYTLQIDESLEKVMPPLSELELGLLTQSLLAEGCRDPLVTWNGKIVDGHNRYRICKENEIPFSYVEMVFDGFSSAKLWIIRNQLARRNVPDYVRCELVLPFEEELKKEAKKRQGNRNDLRNNDSKLNQSEKPGRTLPQLAEMAGVSDGSFFKAKKIAEEADEETKEKLRNGELSIHKAYTALKPKEGPIKPPPVKRPGDIVPGYGTAEIVSQMENKGVYVCPDDSVYDIPPIKTCGNMKVEFADAKSCLQSNTDAYVERVSDIIRAMNLDSIIDEELETLRAIATDGYNKILSVLRRD